MIITIDELNLIVATTEDVNSKHAIMIKEEN